MKIFKLKKNSQCEAVETSEWGAS